MATELDLDDVAAQSPLAMRELEQLRDELGLAMGTPESCERNRESMGAEVERLRKTLAESCAEERSQMWEAGPGGGCERAIAAEAEVERLRKDAERLRIVAAQVLADMEAQGALIEWQTLLKEALAAMAGGHSVSGG